MFKTPLRIMVDVTTRCNAGCPQCHRTDLNGLKAKSWLPDITWNLEQFMTAYSLKFKNTIWVMALINKIFS